MSESDEHLRWVLDQLADLGDVTSRRMFGGAALYLEGVVFAIVLDDVVHFRSKRTGLRPFLPPRGKPSATYFEVPDDVLADPDELVAWARESVRLSRERG